MAEIYRLHRLSLHAPGEALFAAVAAAVPGLSRRQAREAITAGLATVDGARVIEAKHVLAGQAQAVELDLRHGIKRALRMRIHDQGLSTAKPFTVLYEDEHVVVVDKAAGVVSAPMGRPEGGKPERGHVPELLRRMWRKRGRTVKFIGVVHRLDKETSGCLCFALTREAQRLLAVQFASHAAGRTYRCLVDGQPRKDRDTLAGVIAFGPDGRRYFRFDVTARDRLAERARARATQEEDEDDDEDRDGSRGADGDGPGRERRGGSGRDAVTHVTVARRLRHGAELEVTLQTGRTHQIRVSLLAIACPVSGDRLYGQRPGRPLREWRDAPLRPPRMMLHAERLAFDHPVTGQRVEVVATLPGEFTAHARAMDAAGAAHPRRAPGTAPAGAPAGRSAGAGRRPGGGRPSGG